MPYSDYIEPQAYTNVGICNMHINVWNSPARGPGGPKAVSLP